MSWLSFECSSHQNRLILADPNRCGTRNSRAKGRVLRSERTIASPPGLTSYRPPSPRMDDEMATFRNQPPRGHVRAAGTCVVVVPSTGSSSGRHWCACTKKLECV